MLEGLLGRGGWPLPHGLAGLLEVDLSGNGSLVPERFEGSPSGKAAAQETRVSPTL